MVNKLKIALIMMLVTPVVLSTPMPKLTEEISQDVLLPYNFRFNHDDGYGTTQHREENKGEDGIVRGSYGYRDASGIYRHVSYIADSRGFHAVLRTNEPGIDNKNSADVAVVVQSPMLGVNPKAT